MHSERLTQTQAQRAYKGLGYQEKAGGDAAVIVLIGTQLQARLEDLCRPADLKARFTLSQLGLARRGLCVRVHNQLRHGTV